MVEVFVPVAMMVSIWMELNARLIHAFVPMETLLQVHHALWMVEKFAQAATMASICLQTYARPTNAIAQMDSLLKE
jgi:hypothetical protein